MKKRYNFFKKVIEISVPSLFLLPQFPPVTQSCYNACGRVINEEPSVGRKKGD